MLRIAPQREQPFALEQQQPRRTHALQAEEGGPVTRQIGEVAFAEPDHGLEK
jgi:hypothetical protein